MALSLARASIALLPHGLGTMMRRRGYLDYLFHPAVLDFIRQEQSAFADNGKALSVK